MEVEDSPVLSEAPAQRPLAQCTGVTCTPEQTGPGCPSLTGSAGGQHAVLSPVGFHRHLFPGSPRKGECGVCHLVAELGTAGPSPHLLPAAAEGLCTLGGGG